MEMPEPLRAEQDPEKWWSNTVMAVRAALHTAGVKEVSAIGLDWPHARRRPAGWFGAARRPGHHLGRPAQRRPHPRDRGAQSASPRSCLWRAPAQPQASWRRRWSGCSATTRLGWMRLLPASCPRTTCACASPGSSPRTSAMLPPRRSSISRRGAGLRRSALAWVCAESILPELFESADVAGSLTRAAAQELGLQAGVPVVAGSADQPAQAVANGLLDRGDGSVTLGTGGQILCATDTPQADREGPHPHLLSRRSGTLVPARGDPLSRPFAALAARPVAPRGGQPLCQPRPPRRRGAAGRRGPHLPALPRGRALADHGPGRDRCVRRPDAPPSPCPSCPGGPRGRGLLAARDTGRHRRCRWWLRLLAGARAMDWPARSGAASWPTSSASLLPTSMRRSGRGWARRSSAASVLVSTRAIAEASEAADSPAAGSRTGPRARRPLRRGLRPIPARLGAVAGPRPRVALAPRGLSGP